MRKTIKVTEPPATKIGQMVVFQIDAKEAGYDALDITVKGEQKISEALTAFVPFFFVAGVFAFRLLDLPFDF